MTLLAQFAATGGALPAYIEDVFSTYLYTGNGSTQTITNGIDLAGKGGLVWLKSRSNALNNVLIDSARGASGGIYKPLFSNLTNAENTAPSYGVTSLNADGFSLGPPGSQSITNESGYTYASWTFRKQPKFFDVVTWTGNSVSGRTVAHSLGSAPGCVIIKSTSDAFDWYVYHQSLGAGNFLSLNLTDAAIASEAMFGPGNPAPSSTVITLGNSNATNGNGKTYVAYLFAHNAGGFGLTGTDNVISCGSYTGTGAAGNTVNLGYEPQWLMVKNASAAEGDGWVMLDVMRGMPNFFATDQSRYLSANNSNAEQLLNLICPTATGFYIDRAGNPLNSTNNTYIYIAIRRGPMRTPTSGTSVFDPESYSGDNGSNRNITSGFPTDLVISKRSSAAATNVWYDRLRGGTQELYSTNTDAEFSRSGASAFDVMNGIVYPTATAFTNGTGATYVNWLFRRAPGFFDEVCYNGTSSATTIAHNLSVIPELMIVKGRNSAFNWAVYSAALATTDALQLNNSNAKFAGGLSYWNSTRPTASVFSIGTGGSVNGSGSTFVAYLFASCPGVSKVGSYTGSGTTKQIDCGFTAGSRFVMIKRTDSTGDWYVWDSARGIVAGNDPYLLLNDTAAEVTGTDYVDTYTGGFEISSTAPAAINANGGTFIYLAIA